MPASFFQECALPLSRALFSASLNTKQHLYITTSFKISLFKIKESYETARISCQHKTGMAQTLVIRELTHIHSWAPCVSLPQDIMIIFVGS